VSYCTTAYKGNIDDPSKYRGITLLSTFDVVFTKIIDEHLTVLAENIMFTFGA